MKKRCYQCRNWKKRKVAETIVGICLAVKEPTQQWRLWMNECNIVRDDGSFVYQRLKCQSCGGHLDHLCASITYCDSCERERALG
jgi:hypothetical protein